MLHAIYSFSGCPTCYLNNTNTYISTTVDNEKLNMDKKFDESNLEKSNTEKLNIEKVDIETY